MKKTLLLACVAALSILGSCNKEAQENLTKSGLDPKNFEAVVGEDSTALYVLTNKNGMEVCVTNFGARIVSIMTPDINGKLQDVVLGFDSINQYINIPTDFGAAIGRYANRINKGQITVDGNLIQLPTNNYGHCLHGGPKGWQNRVFKANQTSESTIILTLQSPDGDMNFPGNVNVSVKYELTDDNAIDIQYEGTTDKNTVLNMTNHSYFNLNGDPNIPITNDTLFINAETFTPVDSTFMTTGAIVSVKETPLDFTTPTEIGARINEDNVQLSNGHGYDHNWVLRESNDITTVAAKVISPVTGIVLEVLTDQPGIQVYTGNFLDGTVTGKKGITYQQRTAVCLETQVYPDSPNKCLVSDQWPSPFLKPGETYKHHTIFRFSVNK